MKIVSYREAGRSRLGVVLTHGVLDVARAAEASDADGLADPDAFFARGLDALADLRRVVETAIEEADALQYTPEGVVLGRPQRDWVKPGDRFEVEVGSLGRLITGFA